MGDHLINELLTTYPQLQPYPQRMEYWALSQSDCNSNLLPANLARSERLKDGEQITFIIIRRHCSHSKRTIERVIQFYVKYGGICSLTDFIPYYNSMDCTDPKYRGINSINLWDMDSVRSFFNATHTHHIPLWTSNTEVKNNDGD